MLEKNYMFSENNLSATARLDQGVYAEGDTIVVTLQVGHLHKN